MAGSYRAVSGGSNGSCWGDNAQMGNTNSWCYRNRGVLHWVGRSGSLSASVERVRSITDGTSNTIMVGEMHTKTRNRRRTFWAYSYTSYNQSSIVWRQPRQLIADYDRCGAIGGAGGWNTCKRGWGSFHSGGIIHFAFADGRVRGINININMDVLHALASIQGDEVVGEF